MNVKDASAPDQYELARELFREYAAGLGVDLCFQGFEEELERLPEIYGPPSGCLILVRDEQGAVGCVGVRGLSDNDCELKRLFVRERARGQALGRLLAIQAIEKARQLGYRRMVLDTLEGMSAARHIYAALGFREIEPYYENPLPGVRYMAIDLWPGDSSP